MKLLLLVVVQFEEILGLRWQDLDLVSGQLRVEQACYRGQMGSPKTPSRRVLPLPGALVEVLKRYRAGNLSGTPVDLLFQTKSGKPFGGSNLLGRYLKPAGREIGAPWLNWHTLRRTHATYFQLAGGSIKDAQAQLRHSNLSTTLEIYTLPIPAQQRAAVEKLSQILLTSVDEQDQLADEARPATPPIQ